MKTNTRKPGRSRQGRSVAAAAAVVVAVETLEGRSLFSAAPGMTADVPDAEPVAATPKLMLYNADGRQLSPGTGAVMNLSGSNTWEPASSSTSVGVVDPATATWYLRNSNSN